MIWTELLFLKMEEVEIVILHLSSLSVEIQF